jgi:uncharacterized protein
MLSDHALDQLELLLAHQRSVTPALPLDALHGFVTALALTGHPAAIEEWGAWVIDPTAVPTPESGSGSESAPDDTTARLLALIEDLLAQVEADLDDPDYHFKPVVRVYRSDGEQYSDGGVWCAGFLRGIAHASGQWQPFLHQPEADRLLWPIRQLADDDGVAAIALSDATLHARAGRSPSALQREALTEQLPYAVEALAQAFLDFDLVERFGELDRVEFSRSEDSRGEPGVARREDEPCPCGSGKNFLKCCGAQRVLH